MQGKKKLVGVFPILLILVFLFLWMKNGMVSQNTVETPLVSREAVESSTVLELVLLPNESDFVYVGATVLPMGSTKPAKPESVPLESVAQTSEESVDALAPQAPLKPLVTEFYDAYEVILPKETAKGESIQDEKPALVTGFSGTLPLSLPLSSPNVAEEEMRAVYVASAYNLDFPSRPGLSKKELQQELDDIITTACLGGMNTIIFQVRPASDALYDSDIFPVSRYLAAREGGV